jgi:hypothetical protein
MPMFPHLEKELLLWRTSSKLLQQTMMMNMAAPQSLTPTTIGSSSSTPLSKLKLIKLSYIADPETLPEEWLKCWEKVYKLKTQSTRPLTKLRKNKS